MESTSFRTQGLAGSGNLTKARKTKRVQDGLKLLMAMPRKQQTAHDHETFGFKLLPRRQPHIGEDKEGIHAVRGAARERGAAARYT